jgi:ABC-type lipoprotein release transport system permease subunit
MNKTRFMACGNAGRKKSVIVILSLILVVAAFNMVGSLTTYWCWKTKRYCGIKSHGLPMNKPVKVNIPHRRVFFIA